MGAANIDPEGLDPEMRETLSGEAARRVGAAGITVQPRRPNPIDSGLSFIKGLFKKKK